MWGEDSHHKEDLEAILNAGGKHDPLVPNKWHDDPYTERDFVDGTMDKAWEVVYEKIPH